MEIKHAAFFACEVQTYALKIGVVNILGWQTQLQLCEFKYSSESFPQLHVAWADRSMINLQFNTIDN